MTTLFAFGIPGGPEWILIFLVLLLLFGAKKLPELARGIGRSLGEFRRAKDEFEDEVMRGDDDSKKKPPTRAPQASASTSTSTSVSKPAPAAPEEVVEEDHHKEPAGSETGSDK